MKNSSVIEMENPQQILIEQMRLLQPYTHFKVVVGTKAYIFDRNQFFQQCQRVGKLPAVLHVAKNFDGPYMVWSYAMPPRPPPQMALVPAAPRVEVRKHLECAPCAPCAPCSPCGLKRPLSAPITNKKRAKIAMPRGKRSRSR